MYENRAIVDIDGRTEGWKVIKIHRKSRRIRCEATESTSLRTRLPAQTMLILMVTNIGSFKHIRAQVNQQGAPL